MVSTCGSAGASTAPFWKFKQNLTKALEAMESAPQSLDSRVTDFKMGDESLTVVMSKWKVRAKADKRIQ